MTPSLGRIIVYAAVVRWRPVQAEHSVCSRLYCMQCMQRSLGGNLSHNLGRAYSVRVPICSMCGLV